MTKLTLSNIIRGQLNNTMQPIASALHNIDDNFAKAPIQYGNKRIMLLKQGLLLLAEHFNFPATVHYLSAGEFSFNGDRDSHDGNCAPYGDELALLLNTIQTRTGISPSRGHVLPQNGWCKIKHFEAHKLLLLLGEK